ncbi:MULTISPECIES: 4Fe-4S binding protein [Psychrilyobacter]|uniref:4Fe-4S binding protein n=1 Tax=Psychrilyobacter piezotolerans TaxID=2293438 RepID=A0ABX9KH39_9FUSO|nr:MULTISPECIES: 4Fe-4S binding protein [Psychrilyobacter]MCS5422732.1 4Fe-4S binding protein [Psychrilyobacter sp. S5]NDI77982.1 4Fe-4S binding protein [Psychrilyobacter piezotolerans]RDE61926.1 4Fe-4S binding protein [Psychrilyobacter sp. S5]REI41152.1 4Fe-4S binding protein [Psychrilyobacter piezotolerans]
MKIKVKRVRPAVQLGVLFFVTMAGILHQKLGGGPNGAPSIHALCPFGGIESFYSLVTRGDFIKKTFYSNIILVGGSTFLVVTLGRIFCGWICALGTLQDIFGKIGMKIFKKRYNVPKSLDSTLRYLKYIVLIGIIYFTWRTGQLVINSMDPFVAYSHITAGWEELLGEYLLGFGILMGMLLSSLFYDRLFCRYLCPLGAYYAILGRFSLLKIERDKNTCINCNKCDRGCPVGLDIASVNTVDKGECIGCMTCVEVCPTAKKSLEVNLMKKKISSGKLGIIGVAIFFGIILITKGLGIYQTTPKSLAGIFKGNPGNIRGWMTIQEVAQGFDIPLKKFYKELGVSMEELPPETTIKSSEEVLKSAGIDFDHDKIDEIITRLLPEGKDRDPSE